MKRSLVTAFRDKARTQNEALNPATIQINGGASLAASTSGLKRREKLQVGGFLDDDDVKFRVRKTLLNAMPEVGRKLVWVEKAMTFRIDAVNDNAELFYTLGCNAVSAA